MNTYAVSVCEMIRNVLKVGLWWDCVPSLQGFGLESTAIRRTFTNKGLAQKGVKKNDLEAAHTCRNSTATIPSPLAPVSLSQAVPFRLVLDASKSGLRSRDLALRLR